MRRRPDEEQRDDELAHRHLRDDLREPPRPPARGPKQRWSFQAWVADLISETAAPCNAGVLQPPVKIGGRP